MNTSLLIFTVIATLALIFAVYCGIKLYDISSSFVPIIRHGALPLGIIISIVAILVCARPTIEEEVNITIPATVMMVSAIAMMIVGFICSIINDHVSKHDPEKEVLSFAGPFILDLIGGLITAVAVGCSVAMGSSFSMVAMPAIPLFLIKEKVALIFRYKDEWSRKKVILDIALPLILIVPISVGLTFLFSRDAMFDASMISVTCGYLAYHSAFHAYFIAKSFKK
jgi:hypothetical protein